MVTSACHERRSLRLLEALQQPLHGRLAEPSDPACGRVIRVPIVLKALFENLRSPLAPQALTKLIVSVDDAIRTDTVTWIQTEIADDQKIYIVTASSISDTACTTETKCSGVAS